MKLVIVAAIAAFAVLAEAAHAESGRGAEGNGKDGTGPIDNKSPRGTSALNQSVRHAKELIREYRKNPTDDNFFAAVIDVSHFPADVAQVEEGWGKTLPQGFAEKKEGKLWESLQRAEDKAGHR